MPVRLTPGVPTATPGFDASEGLLTTAEIAARFFVDQKTAARWAQHSIAAVMNGEEPKAAVMRTPGGDWRFSAKWAREQLGG